MDKDNTLLPDEEIKPVRINGIELSKLQGSVKMTEEPERESEMEEEPHLTDREVMEHTASIWQYNPIKDVGIEMHTEYHAKHTVTESGELIAARARGKKHKHDGSNCDDWFETAVVDDCFIAVAADGAGSKSLSRIGARITCENAVEYLKSHLSELFSADPDIKTALASDMSDDVFMAACGKIAPLVQNAARNAFDAVINQLKSIYNDKAHNELLGRKPMLSDYSSTYLAAIIIPLEINGEKHSFSVTAQIGDGCICAIDSKADSQSCLKLLGEADSGAFSGETDFLSEKTVNDNVITGKTRISRGRSDIFMIMTDGVADDYFPAHPMAKRLYLDLCLNGILPMEGDASVAEQPEPIRFRSVTMSQRSVELQYAKQLIGDTDNKDAINMLWDKKESLKCHSLEAYGISLGDKPQERLLTWLDNYNERGSFDDRTLIIINLNTKE